MHNGLDVKRVGSHTVNDGVGEAAEFELAILAPDSAPTFRLGRKATQRAFKLIKEVIAQPRLPFLIPPRGGFQFYFDGVPVSHV